jgi:hypothetical protein
VFKPQEHAACTSCHRDPHAGALGTDCARCHNTAGWLQIAGDRFDHDKTRYPLEGKHAKVACAQCHGGGRRKPAFSACTDCHRDVHGGERLARPELTACESCHTVFGFAPANYTLTRHADSRFPLRGAHRAVACSGCHEPVADTGQLEDLYARAADLAPAHDSCTDCHRDPHRGQTTALTGPAGRSGCLVCHDDNTWRTPRFDHSATRFALDGAHARAACTKCHKPEREGDAVDIPFRDTVADCAACHEDVHRGQFADRRTPQTGLVGCARCHVTLDWLAEKFDHEKDSRFPLRGGHEKVACTACHIPDPDDADRFVRYKPLPVDCRSCHAADPKGTK